MCTEIPDIFVDKRWLINDSTKIIDNALHGLIRCNPHLALLDAGRVVVQRDHLKSDKVKIISGGASGHEPSFAGFVGSGMLTAAVQGGIYSSPTPHLILRTIKELTRRHDKGVMVIINDNMSDRLSFGLGIERAKNFPNIKIRYLQVDDDCNKSLDSRGLTGCILVQKIAGAMAEAGQFLFEIYVFCKTLVDNIASVTVSLKPAISPYFQISSCAQTITKDLEYGGGIHGQPGFSKTPLISSHECIKTMLGYIYENKVQFKLDPNVHVIILINNLGHSTKLEELIFINETITQLQSRDITVERVYTGTYLTSLEMSGFSLTLLNITNPDILTYLDAPTDAPYWKTFGQVILDPEASLTISTELCAREQQFKPNRGPVVCDKSAQIIENVISFACGALICCEKQLNIIDSESGDSDTGTNLRIPAHKITDYLTKGKLKIQWPFMLFEELSKILETTSEGLMSCFYAIMFEAAAKPLFTLTEHDLLTIEHWLQVFDSVCKAVERYGRTSLGKNTMFDALQMANEAFHNAIASNVTSVDAVGLAAVAAEDAAKHTRVLGALYPDPGAHAVGIWMRAVYESLKLYPDYFV